MKQFILFIASIAFLASCNEQKKEKQEEAKLMVTSPIQMDTIITKNYISQIHSFRNIEVRALEKGYLQSISVDEGQFVKKGQPMFTIKANVYQAELEKAECRS